MSYTPTYREGFLSVLMTLPHYLQKRIEKVDAELRNNPTAHHGGNVKKLKGFKRLWRYRLDNYRLIYAVREHLVEYIDVGPRKEIYERLSYDPDNPDEANLAEVEAKLAPDPGQVHNQPPIQPVKHPQYGKLLNRWGDAELRKLGLTDALLTRVRQMNEAEELWASEEEFPAPIFGRLHDLLHPPSPPPLFISPPAPRKLVDRDGECEVLLNCLVDEPASLICLVGASGMGKTTLATWLYNVARGPEYQVRYLACTEHKDITVDSLLTALSVDAPEAQQARIRGHHHPLRDHMQATLEFLNEQRCLLVFDDYDALSNREQMDQFVTGAFRYSQNVRIVLTARDRPAFLNDPAWQLGAAKDLPLRGLSLESISELMKVTEPAVNLTSDQLTIVWKKESGNPGALIKAKPRIREYAWKGDLESLPSYSEEWLKDFLTDEAWHLAERLSIIGTGLNAKLISRLFLGVPLSLVGELVDKDVLKELEPAGTFLMDDSARDFLYEKTDENLRREVHRVAGYDFASQADETQDNLQASAYLVQALNHFELAGDCRREILARSQEAYDRLMAQGDWDGAQAIAEKALWAARQEADMEGVCDWLIKIAERNIDREQLGEAETHLQEVVRNLPETVPVSLLEQTPNWAKYKMHSLIQQGRLAYRKSDPDYNLAITLYTKALSLARELGDQLSEAWCLYRIGQVDRRQERYGQAKEHFSQAFDLAQELGSTELVYECMNHLGVIARKQDEDEAHFQEALQDFQAAVGVADRTDNRLLKEESLSHLGRLATQMGRLAAQSGRLVQSEELLRKSKGLLQDALAVAKEIRNNRGIRIELTRLIDTLIELREYEEAKELLVESEQRNKADNDRLGIAWNLKHLGQLEQAHGEVNEGNVLIRQGIQQLAESGFPEYRPEFEAALKN